MCASIRSAFSALTSLAFLLSFSSAWAQTHDEDDAEEVFADLIHSDVPLFGSADKIWPQAFINDDDFGCASRIALGDWRYLDQELWRLANYGVFHCGIVETRGRELTDLEGRFDSYSHFVELGEFQINGKDVELWALQSGTAPGSDYTLLSANRGAEAQKSFSVLQRKCPNGQMRVGPELDVWTTSYCAINSQSDLISMAKDMAKLPPLGLLTFVDKADEEDEEALNAQAVAEAEAAIQKALEDLERQVLED